VSTTDGRQTRGMCWLIEQGTNTRRSHSMRRTRSQSLARPSLSWFQLVAPDQRSGQRPGQRSLIIVSALLSVVSAHYASFVLAERNSTLRRGLRSRARDDNPSPPRPSPLSKDRQEAVNSVRVASYTKKLEASADFRDERERSARDWRRRKGRRADPARGRRSSSYVSEPRRDFTLSNRSQLHTQEMALAQCHQTSGRNTVGKSPPREPSPHILSPKQRNQPLVTCPSQIMHQHQFQ
jgi:hypothetical protein